MKTLLHSNNVLVRRGFTEDCIYRACIPFDKLYYFALVGESLDNPLNEPLDSQWWPMVKTERECNFSQSF